MTTLNDAIAAADTVAAYLRTLTDPTPVVTPPPVIAPPVVTPPATPPSGVVGPIPGFTRTRDVILVIPDLGAPDAPQVITGVARTDCVIVAFTVPATQCELEVRMTTYDAANIIRWSLSESRWDWTGAIARGNQVNNVLRFGTRGGATATVVPGKTYYLNAELLRKTPPANADFYLHALRVS